MEAKEIVSKDTSLWKAISTLTDFEVYSSITVATCKLVHFNELLRDAGDLDANIFRLRHRSIQVEVFMVNGTETSPLERTLLRRRLTSSNEEVLVPTSPG